MGKEDKIVEEAHLYFQLVKQYNFHFLESQIFFVVTFQTTEYKNKRFTRMLHYTILLLQ